TAPTLAAAIARKRDVRWRDGLRQRPEWITIPLVFVLVILGWHWGTRWFEVQAIVFPGPVPVAEALWNGLRSGIFLQHLWITFKEIIGGFVIGCGAGLILGAVISQFRLLEKTVFGYLVVLQTVPKLAIAPLFV